jgi:hypothetical protein
MNTIKKAQAPCLASKCAGDSDEEALFASVGGVEASQEAGR